MDSVGPVFFIISIALLFILLSSCSFLLLTHNSLTFNLSLPALKLCNSPGGKIPELWGSDIQEPTMYPISGTLIAPL